MKNMYSVNRTRNKGQSDIPWSTSHHSLFAALMLSVVIFSVGVDAEESVFHKTGIPSPGGQPGSWVFRGDSELFSDIKPASDPAGIADYPVMRWDSEKQTSSLFFPFGRQLSHEVDFSASVVFQLRSLDIEFDPGSFYGFQLSLGFFNSERVFLESYRRITGSDSPDLVEWDFFPDTGFGATISPTIVDSASQFFPTFNFPIDLPVDEDIEVTLEYVSEFRELRSTLRAGEGELRAMETVKLPGPDDDSFAGFMVDSFGFTSFRDFDDSGSFSAEAQIIQTNISWSAGAPSISGHLKPARLSWNEDQSHLKISIPQAGDTSHLVRLWRSTNMRDWHLDESRLSAPGESEIQMTPQLNFPDVSGDKAFFFQVDALVAE